LCNSQIINNCFGIAFVKGHFICSRYQLISSMACLPTTNSYNLRCSIVVMYAHQSCKTTSLVECCSHIPVARSLRWHAYHDITHPSCGGLI
jgi:hypothetical protein